ncbi:hypothetical protein [Micromonospora sp. NPDC049679]|uniref:hypothetical protein n=1 Tax=Micromonospora sp. NPDC049679 TaxID=3155920 RepID=UPI00340591C7
MPAPALPVWPAPSDPTAPRSGRDTSAPSGNVTSAGSADVAPRRGGQRPSGTVYGGAPSGAARGFPEPDPTMITMPVSNPLENSGSLTGHILAQGRADTVPEGGSTAKVLLMLLAGLGLLIVVGVLVVLIVGDAFSSLFGGLLGG